MEDGSEDHAIGDGVTIQFPTIPPLVDVVVGADEQRFPRSRHENALEEHFAHVEYRDDDEQTDKLQHQIEVFVRIAVCTGRRDLWWQSEHEINDHKPEWNQRHEVVELVRSIHAQTQHDGHEVQPKENL